MPKVIWWFYTIYKAEIIRSKGKLESVNSPDEFGPLRSMDQLELAPFYRRSFNEGTSQSSAPK